MEDQPQSENPFFLNLADLLVGILFIFIIILFFFAINYALALQENQKIRRFIIESNEIRREILEKIGNSLSDEGLNVHVDGSDGVLRLSDSQLFETGEFNLSVTGSKNIFKLKMALEKVLPCFAKVRGPVSPAKCGADTEFHINAFLVEGHADVQRVIPNSKYSSNEELSTKRALSAYNELYKSPILSQLYNDNDQYLISVSGYGAKRALCSELTVSCHSQNRRIELRILMAPPDASILD